MTTSLIEAMARAIENADMSAVIPCDRCKGSGYHHGFGEQGHDPDWCSVCGGASYVDDQLIRSRAALSALQQYASEHDGFLPLGDGWFLIRNTDPGPITDADRERIDAAIAARSKEAP